MTPQFVYPNIQISTLAGPIRTLASRKAYDEPDVEVTNRRKKESERFHPYTPARPGAAPGFREPTPGVAAAAAVLGLDLVTKWPFAANTINNGELTIDNLRQSDHGVYECVVHNDVATIVARSALRY